MSREITCKIWTGAAVPQKEFGPRVFKFQEMTAEIMVNNGWEVVGKKKIPYLKAPASHKGKWFVAKVTIPDDEEIIALALKLHAEGHPWKGQALGCNVEYMPKHVFHFTLHHGTGDNAEVTESSTEYPARLRVQRSNWRCEAEWVNGEDAPPVLKHSEDNVVA